MDELHLPPEAQSPHPPTKVNKRESKTASRSSHNPAYCTFPSGRSRPSSVAHAIAFNAISFKLSPANHIQKRVPFSPTPQSFLTRTLISSCPAALKLLGASPPALPS